MIKLKDLLTEGKITSDVERAAKKIGIKFNIRLFVPCIIIGDI